MYHSPCIGWFVFFFQFIKCLTPRWKRIAFALLPTYLPTYLQYTYLTQ